jgi:hypothetical protein
MNFHKYEQDLLTRIEEDPNQIHIKFAE